MKEEHLNIVVVEDSEMDYELIVRSLKKYFSNLETTMVATSDAMTAAIENRHTDIILSDYNVPGFGAPAALEVLRSKHSHEIPLIVVSGAVGDEKAAEVIKAGASDFVMKDNLQRLAPAIKQALADFEQKRLESVRRKQAEEASSVRMQGLAVASHDLKNPLNSIQISIEMIRKNLYEPGGPAKIEKYLNRMDNAAVRISSLISDYVDQTRIDKGSFSITKNTARLDLLMNEISEVFLPIAEKKGIELKVSVPGVETFGCFDYSRMFQALLNIIGNAIKFTNSGGSVSVHLDNSSGKEVVIEVSDTGVGIQQKNLPLIFKRFWQQGGSKEKGSAGLGLSIAKGIIVAHGGQLIVASEPGVGTCFKIVIPNDIRSEVTQVPHHSKFGCKNVVLVEDDVDLKEIFCELLVSEGFNVTSLDNGLSALEHISSLSSPIDLVILDYQLPGLNGTDLAKRIRQLSNDIAKVPIMITSAELNLAKKIDGCDDVVFVKKPIAINDFMKAVDKTLQNKRAKS